LTERQGRRTIAATAFHGAAEDPWDMRRRKATLLGLLLLGVFGCSGIQLARPRSPVPGLRWAFFSDGDTVLGPAALVYTSSEPRCEQERLRRFHARPCVRIVVGSGTDYHVLALPSEFDLSLPDGGIGSTERERCERFRAFNMLSYQLLGDCEPVGVKLAE
jgi:hypothetical protein